MELVYEPRRLKHNIYPPGKQMTEFDIENESTEEENTTTNEDKYGVVNSFRIDKQTHLELLKYVKAYNGLTKSEILSNMVKHFLLFHK